MTMIYNIKDFNEIMFNGFLIELPSETIQTISNLTLQVGSPTYVKTPIFNKREHTHLSLDNSNNAMLTNTGNGGPFNTIKRKKNRGVIEYNNEDWETLRNYQTTKITKKQGIDAEIDNIRSFLNKLTDKNYNEIKHQIIEVLQNIQTDTTEQKESTQEQDEIIIQVGEHIFSIASNNRFYSKMYADLYSELINTYEPMKRIFEDSFNKFMELFNTIEYVDPETDYDTFCKINKLNEQRKSLSCFFVNSMTNGILSKSQILNVIHKLLDLFHVFISIDNKTNEVNEISENIALLFKRDYFSKENLEKIKIAEMDILTYISFIANSKSKDFKSLSTKSIFKFMDIIDM